MGRLFVISLEGCKQCQTHIGPCNDIISEGTRLSSIQDEEFKNAAKDYIGPLLTKVKILEEVILELEKSYRMTHRLSAKEEDSSTLGWTLCLVAQHHDKMRRYDLALSKIEEAITMIGLESDEDQISGELTAEKVKVDRLFSMHLSGLKKPLRLVRLKYVIPVFSCNKTESGGEFCAINYYSWCEKHDTFWKEYVSLKNCFRKGDFVLGFEKFEAVKKHYTNLFDDQQKAYFQKAVACAIRCQIKSYDSRVKYSTTKVQMGEAENHLMEATQCLNLLEIGDSFETYLVSFELYLRKQEIEHAFQAVKQLVRLDAKCPDSHSSKIRFLHMVVSMPTSKVKTKDKDAYINALCNTNSDLPSEREEEHAHRMSYLVNQNDAFLSEHIGSLMHRAAVAEMSFILTGKKTKAVEIIKDSHNKLLPGNGALGLAKEWKVKDCITVHKLLESVIGDSDAALLWKERCAEYFPNSSYFEGWKSSKKSNVIGEFHIKELCDSTTGKGSHRTKYWDTSVNVIDTEISKEAFIPNFALDYPFFHKILAINSDGTRYAYVFKDKSQPLSQWLKNGTSVCTKDDMRPRFKPILYDILRGIALALRMGPNFTISQKDVVITGRSRAKLKPLSFGGVTSGPHKYGLIALFGESVEDSPELEKLLLRFDDARTFEDRLYLNSPFFLSYGDQLRCFYIWYDSLFFWQDNYRIWTDVRMLVRTNWTKILVDSNNDAQKELKKRAELMTLTQPNGITLFVFARGLWCHPPFPDPREAILFINSRCKGFLYKLHDILLSEDINISTPIRF